MVSGVGAKVGRRRALPSVNWHHPGHHLLAPLGGRHPGYRHLGHRWVAGQDVVDLPGVNV